MSILGIKGFKRSKSDRYQQAVVGTDTFLTSNVKYINVGFRPAYLAITKTRTASHNTMMIYSKDYATNKFRDADASHYARDLAFGVSDGMRLRSITDTGFVINPYSTSGQEFQYIAIPENWGGNVKVGEVTYSTSSRTHVNCGFKPNYIIMTKTKSTTNTSMFIYSKDYYVNSYRVASASTYAQNNNTGTTTNGAIYSIDNDGFTINKNGQANTLQYIAIGEKVNISPYINGLKQTSVLYTGSAVTSEVDTDLILGTDYTVEYSNNVNKGTATATIRGIGAYSGSVSFNFEVTDYTVGFGNYSTSTQTHINLGFKPAYLVLTRANASPQTTMMEIYSKDYNTTKYRMASSSAYAQDKNFNATNNALIYSIDNDGFTVNKDSSANSFQYFAIPESYSGNVAIGIANFSSTESQSVNLGFKPKYLALTRTADASAPETDMHIYSEDYSTTNYRYAASTTYAKDQNLNTTEGARIYSIDNNGFTVNKRSTGTKLQYIALG